MDLRRRLARASLPAAALITILSIAIPAPAAATEPVASDTVTTTLPATEPATDPAPTPAAPVDPTVVVVPTTPVAAPATTTSVVHHRRRRSAATRFIRVARRQLGDRYVYGAMGPGRFDCSGLVLFALRHSHNRRVVHSGLRSARSILQSYRRHHRASRHHGRRGDLVVWGGGTHIGIYLGHGRAISALTRRGVSVHRIDAVTMPFTAFLHTRLATR